MRMAARRMDADGNTEYVARAQAWIDHVQSNDLAIGIAILVLLAFLGTIWGDVGAPLGVEAGPAALPQPEPRVAHVRRAGQEPLDHARIERTQRGVPADPGRRRVGRRPGGRDDAAAQAHLDRTLTVDDLANRANMSARTFARRFKQETGTTPHRWLTHQRILSAQQLLEKSDRPIDWIAESIALSLVCGEHARPQIHRVRGHGTSRQRSTMAEY